MESCYASRMLKKCGWKGMGRSKPEPGARCSQRSLLPPPFLARAGAYCCCHQCQLVRASSCAKLTYRCIARCRRIGYTKLAHDVLASDCSGLLTYGTQHSHLLLRNCVRAVVLANTLGRRQRLHPWTAQRHQLSFSAWLPLLWPHQPSRCLRRARCRLPD